MRGLTADEARILRETIPGAPHRGTEAWEEPVLRALVARGLVTEHEDETSWWWVITSLGRLALAANAALTVSLGVT